MKRFHHIPRLIIGMLLTLWMIAPAWAQRYLWGSFKEFPPVSGSSLGVDKVVQQLTSHPRAQ